MKFVILSFYLGIINIVYLGWKMKKKDIETPMVLQFAVIFSFIGAIVWLMAQFMTTYTDDLGTDIDRFGERVEEGRCKLRKELELDLEGC